jgi:hypothetical protein
MRLSSLAGIALAFGVGALVGVVLDKDPSSAPINFDNRPDARIEEKEGLPRANVTRSRRIARKIYGNVCRGNVRIRFQELPARQAGEAHYDYDPVQPLDTRRYGSCVIIISTAARYSPIIHCGILVHEWGHLAGHGHSRNPRSVMYPKLTLRNLPQSCRR